ncbi:hypothetical protein A9Q98_05245 [Thalassotalea sp. 42_200_T64]|nr:hypothetical protein A9Q98_05245 [Thalassotalea sp. 42_200_T64]
MRLQKLPYSYGFTIVEVMVSLTLGLFLLSVSMQGLFSVNKSFINIQQTAKMQETARFAFALIENDIKQSRYWNNTLPFSTFAGSALLTDATQTTCIESGTSWGRQLQQPVFAINNSATGYACIKNDDYLIGDILTLRYASTEPVGSYDNQQIYLRSDGASHRLFIGRDRSLAINKDLTNALTQQIVAHSFYIGDSQRECQSQIIPSLYWQTLVNGRPQREELLSGVEQLQIQFAIDNDEDNIANKYVNPNQVLNWRRILSVKVDLLLRSDCPDKAHFDNKNYPLADINYQVNDNFHRLHYQYTFNYH